METPPTSTPDIPGYQLFEKIGEGGMGEVYRARQIDPPRDVAVKFLNPPARGQAALLADYFQRESKLMSSLDHSNIVAILDSGQIGERFFLVMEHVPGSTLRSLMIAGQPWPVERAAPLLDAIAKALSYIHSREILHLDLKPENVLCTEDGAVKITDFGLALTRMDALSLAELGLVQGTIDYCAPEQRYGLPIDQRADLFSLATLAYELVTGHLPGRIYVPCSDRNPELPQALDEVLRKGLARDRDDRYPTIEQFRHELTQALRQ